jgi:hypothetical protein
MYNMETRSTSNPTLGKPEPPPAERYVRPTSVSTYNVDIDFDAATAAWMRNKLPYSACMSYRCQAVKSDGKPCKKRAMEQKLTVNPQPFLCSSHIYSWRMNRGAMRLVDYAKQEE